MLIENGVPRDHIIHMAYDDIAYNEANPFPGQLFNRPSGHLEGVNVYDPDHIDYRGDMVIKKNFRAVLLGNDAAADGHPVLKSTEQSSVLLYVVGHGGAGFFPFPANDSSDDWMFADELDKILH